jgi:flagellar motility protein MotE (MotC chaperone)
MQNRSAPLRDITKSPPVKPDFNIAPFARKPISSVELQPAAEPRTPPGVTTAHQVWLASMADLLDSSGFDGSGFYVLSIRDLNDSPTSTKLEPVVEAALRSVIHEAQLQRDALERISLDRDSRRKQAESQVVQLQRSLKTATTTTTPTSGLKKRGSSTSLSSLNKPQPTTGLKKSASLSSSLNKTNHNNVKSSSEVAALETRCRRAEKELAAATKALEQEREGIAGTRKMAQTEYDRLFESSMSRDRRTLALLEAAFRKKTETAAEKATTERPQAELLAFCQRVCGLVTKYGRRPQQEEAEEDFVDDGGLLPTRTMARVIPQMHLWIADSLRLQASNHQKEEE